MIDARNVSHATAVHDAAYYGNARALVTLLELVDTALLQSRCARNSTAVVSAAARGHAECVAVMLDHCPPDVINATDITGATALLAAVADHRSRRVLAHAVREELLEHSCFRHSSITTREGISDHYHNTSFGRREVAACLLEHPRFTAVGAVLPKNHFNALHLASWEGYQDIVETLVGSASFHQLDTSDKYGNRPLHLAARQAHLGAWWGEVKACHKGCTLWHDACSEGERARAFVLVFCCVLPFFVSPCSSIEVCVGGEGGFGGLGFGEGGIQVLFLVFVAVAIDFGSVGCLRPCVPAGVVATFLGARVAVDVDAKTRHGHTALHCAAQGGHAPVAQALLQHPLFKQVNSKDDVTGATALHEAAASGHCTVTKILLAEPRCRGESNRDGRTALHLASCSGHTEVVHLLAQAQSSINRRCHRGCTALHCAVERGHKAVVGLLSSSQRGSPAQGWDKLFCSDVKKMLGRT